MCGIFSVYSFNKESNNNKIKKGLEIINHRGNDGSGIYTSKNKKVILGHARLSIIDLSGGKQPISNNDLCHIVANGELYGHDEEIKRLQNKGYEFKTQSDSETALHGYVEQGINYFNKMRGEYVVNLYDEKNDIFIGLRDRFGIKPLYYTIQEDRLYIASEVKSFKAAGLTLELNEESYQYREFQYGNNTLFKNIYEVPAGHYIKADKSGYKILKYWDFNYPKNKKENIIDTELATKKVHDKLIESIELRLRTDVPYGVYLSGGIDSCAVLGIVSSLEKNPIDTFTISFDDSMYDESDIAYKMSKHVGSNHHELKVTEKDIVDNFFNAVYHTETTAFNSHFVAKYLLSKFTRENGIKVVLTGEGSDELFAGYPNFRNDLIKYEKQSQEKINKLLSKNKEVSNLILSDDSEYKILEEYFGFIPSWIPPLIKQNEITKDTFGSKIFKKINSLEAIHIFHKELDLEQITNIHPVNLSLYTLTKTMLPNYIFKNLGDKVEMAHTIEGRVPYLDHELVEFVKELSINHKISDMTEKFILREAVKPYIIEEVYNRQKKVFYSPPRILVKGSLFNNLLNDSIRSQDFKNITSFDQQKIINFLDNVDKIKQEQWGLFDAILTEILSLYALQQKIIK